MLSAALALTLFGTGCATKKYVAKSIAPVEQRVGGTETKNGEQDKTLASHGSQIEGLDQDLSKTKEKLTDADNKATQAGEAAKAADQKAAGAQTAADGAKQAADGARSFAEQGLTKLDQSMQAMNKYQMAKTESILFGFNKDTLTDDAKMQLDDLAKQAGGLNRYVIEVQGFTDKSGSAAYNESLSERRAQTVARYLANQYQIPVRSISMLGSGYAQPVADDKTRDGRKMNRRVEVRLWVPESESPKTTALRSEQ
jgi:outer membrane protein OmpA-like peptidoglycan-associated protein